MLPEVSKRPSEESPTHLKRFRRVRVCPTCRALKIKCDGSNSRCGPSTRHPKKGCCDSTQEGRSRTETLEETLSLLEKRLRELEEEDPSSSTPSDKPDSARVELAHDIDTDSIPFAFKPYELAHLLDPKNLDALECPGGTQGPSTSRTRESEEGPYPSDPNDEDPSAKPHAMTYLTRIFNKYRKIGTGGRSIWMSESNKLDPRTMNVRSGTNITINIDNTNHSNSGNTTSYTTTNSHNTSSVMDYSRGNTNYTNNGSGTLNNPGGSASIQYGGNHTASPCPSCWLRCSYSWWPCFYWDGWMSVFCGWMPYICSWF